MREGLLGKNFKKSMKKFEILEHKADLKIRVFGKTKEELFENAMLGMFRLADVPPAYEVTMLLLQEIVDCYMQKVSELKEHCERCLRTE
jgi:SHS2 domain-containing protein